MNVKSDASLRGKIRAIAGKYDLRAQEVMQMYLFEHLLLRLENCGYVDRFVLKGGLLISSMIGVARRTTMDMDTTVVDLSMDKENIEKVMTEICATSVEDGMTYVFERVEPIREDDEYANWRAHIKVRYGRIDAPIKVDITTGDSIEPCQILYRYPMMFEDGFIEIASYSVATILAEKFETVVSRGVANTRSRDFYDIYAFLKMRRDAIDAVQLRKALEATAEKRGSVHNILRYRSILEDVKASDAMLAAWETYTETVAYARGIAFREVVDSAIELGDMILG